MSRGSSSEIPASSSSSRSSSPDKNLTRRQRRQQQLQQSAIINEDSLEAITTLFPTSLFAVSNPAMAVRLLVCSIGNPGAYMNTLHSAGHAVLNTLAVSLSYPSFAKSRAYNGLLSQGGEFTLWQSTSLMNISGVGVAAAWKQFVKESRGEEIRLIVVHDELELGLGQVKVKSGTASAKGHNGLKSIKECVKGDWTRIGVGIGRPESRDPNVVAEYVLRKMSGQEKAKLEACTGGVERELRRMAGG